MRSPRFHARLALHPPNPQAWPLFFRVLGAGAFEKWEGMTNPAGIDLATGEGVFVSTHGGGLSLGARSRLWRLALSRIQVRTGALRSWLGVAQFWPCGREVRCDGSLPLPALPLLAGSGATLALSAFTSSCCPHADGMFSTVFLHKLDCQAPCM